jgi:DNA-binding transcriptional LysR family regulator
MADGILSPKLLASPVYLEKCKPTETPQNLLGHRLLAITRWKPENSWSFANANGKDKDTLTFQPDFSMNDYTGLASALLAGAGVGELPPLVQPELPRNGRLVEVMPKWRLRTLNFSVAHLANRYIPRPVRIFKEFAAQMSSTLFPTIPT